MRARYEPERRSGTTGPPASIRPVEQDASREPVPAISRPHRHVAIRPGRSTRFGPGVCSGSPKPFAPPANCCEGATPHRTHGFTVAGATNADSQDHATTVVGYGPGERDRAQTVARFFPGAGLRPATTAGISLTLGQTYLTAPSPGASAPSTPSALPSKVAEDARSADDDPCSNLSYG
ncbi:hypothetical protein SANTM175S_05143 [Streptomyces antimycoticus]